MQSLQRFIRPGATHGRETDKSCFTVCGGRRLSHKNLRMHPLSTYTSGKGIHKSVTTTKAFPIHCWKDTGTILLNRLNVHLDQKGLIPESQCGFRKDRGTIDMIFTARQLQKKCQWQNVDLYMTFVDLTKAFGTVSRDGLWKSMAKFGCPPRFIAMLRQFQDRRTN